MPAYIYYTTVGDARAPMSKREGMRFRYYTLISLLLHAAVILPFLLTTISGKKPVRLEEKLNLELFGMLSERQEEEEQQAETPEIPDAPAPPKPAPPKLVEPEKPAEEMPEETPKPLFEQPAQIPVEEIQALPVFDNPMEIPPPPDAPEIMPSTTGYGTGVTDSSGDGAAGVSVPAAGGSGDGAGTGTGGAGTRSVGAAKANTIDIYINNVANRLQSNLVYPARLRRDGIEAVTTIAFTVTESGQIKRNSLEVRKSSGYREMDDNALRAARESAPFDKPPKEMTLVIAVAFEVERSRR